jgi:glycosyltransferase involved in cell wall biosynthesis
LVANSLVRDVFEFTGYLPHLEALARVRAANLLFLPMYGLPPGRRASIVPGKTYEYMASGQPILAALPAGDARDFVSQAGNGFCCAPDDVRGMLNILKARYACWRRGEEAVPWQPDYVQRFERRELTRQLAQLLDGVMGSRGHGPAGERLEEMALAGRT